jgi:hypothetical protein
MASISTCHGSTISGRLAVRTSDIAHRAETMQPGMSPHLHDSAKNGIVAA